MKIGIITAMDSEFAALTGILGGAEGVVGGNSVVVRKGGIGKVNAAVATVKFIEEVGPDCIISTGCAGGLAPDVHKLDVFAASEVVYHDVWCGEPNKPGQVQGLPARFAADPVLLSTAKSIAADGFTSGLCCSGDWFCTEKSEIETIARKFPEGKSVDMESGAIAQVCHISGVPFLSIRIVSDSVSEEDRNVQYDDFWSKVSGKSFGFVLSLLKNLPSKIQNI